MQKLIIFLFIAIVSGPLAASHDSLADQGIEIIKSEYGSLDEILQSFKGEVVYIDFWASWCRPCLQEMPHSLTLQEKLNSENIVFLFLAVNDRAPAWEEKVISKKIKGKHIFLNSQLSQQARRKFAFNAIPHYAIIAKDGSIEYVSALPPSYESTYTDLLNLSKE